MDAVETAPVDGVDSDLTMTSFDGTEIRLHWFPVEGASADEPAPTILMGPGWSLAGDTSTDGAALFGALSIGGMWDAGYNVLTWDPRGFGESDGVATVNDPAKEGRDVQALLDFVAEQPEALTDAEGDPRAGMVGFSYGGGIQLTTAAIDCRIDALVPGIAWNSLETSLYKADTVKTGWSKILTSTVDPDPPRPAHRLGVRVRRRRRHAQRRGPRSGSSTAAPATSRRADRRPHALRPGHRRHPLHARRGHHQLRDPARATTSPPPCSGSAAATAPASPTPATRERVAKASFDWLDHYLKGDAARAGARRSTSSTRTATQWSVETWDPQASSGGASGEHQRPRQRAGAERRQPLRREHRGRPTAIPLGGLVSGITPTEADGRRSTRRSDPSPDRGPAARRPPTMRLTYAGTLPEGETDGRIFAQFVDDETGLVIGNQITPMAVVARRRGPRDRGAARDHRPPPPPGHRPSPLQIVATTSAYATPPLGGTIEAKALSYELPFAPDSTSADATATDGEITETAGG